MALAGRDLSVERGDNALAFAAKETLLDRAEKTALASPDQSLKVGDKKRAVTAAKSKKSPLGAVLGSLFALARKK